jgi:hypothetical protein
MELSHTHLRPAAVLAFVVGLAACTPPAPIENGGVGFESYSEYQRRREVELSTARQTGGPGPVTYYQPQSPAGTTYAGTPGGYPAASGGISAGPITSGPIGATSPAGGVGTAAVATTAAPPVVSAGAVVASSDNAGISDEQDFSAVSARETIESDRQRMADNRAQYVQIAPQALPERDGASASPIIEYAINAPNRLGQSIYGRSGLSLSNSQNACARYSSPAAAQEAFLKSGGPKRDPKNLDPDGDGFACSWDPTPFQKVRG